MTQTRFVKKKRQGGRGLKFPRELAFSHSNNALTGDNAKTNTKKQPNIGMTVKRIISVADMINNSIYCRSEEIISKERLYLLYLSIISNY